MIDPKKSFTFRVDEALLREFQSFAADEGSNAAVEIRRAMKRAIADRVERSLAQSGAQSPDNQ